MPKHTSGPWFVFPNDHCVGGPYTPVPGDAPDQTTAGIAMCAMRLRPPEECEANARLIAAAPELLAACELALPAIEKALTVRRAMGVPDRAGGIATIRDLIVAAIAKAKGELP